LSRARSEFTVEPTGSVQVIVSGTVTRSLACSVAVAPTFTVMVPNPFVEAVRAAERWQIPPRPDVSVLDGVMGKFWVAKDQSSRGRAASASSAKASWSPRLARSTRSSWPTSIPQAARPSVALHGRRPGGPNRSRFDPDAKTAEQWCEA